MINVYNMLVDLGHLTSKTEIGLSMLDVLLLFPQNSIKHSNLWVFSSTNTIGLTYSQVMMLIIDPKKVVMVLSCCLYQ